MYLQVVVNSMLTNHQTSAGFAMILLDYLMKQLQQLGSRKLIFFVTTYSNCNVIFLKTQAIVQIYT